MTACRARAAAARAASAACMAEVFFGTGTSAASQQNSSNASGRIWSRNYV